MTWSKLPTGWWLHVGDEPKALDEAPELLGDRHRAVAPARAADRDREIRLALALIGRHQEFEEAFEPLQQLVTLGVLHDEVAHARITPVERSQLVDEVRVGEEADVEDEIGVDRDPVLEPERHQRHRQSRSGLGCSIQLDQQLLELVDVHRRGVDDAVGDLAHVRQGLALGTDGLQHVAVAAEGMSTSRLVVAADERFVARLDVQHLDGVAAGTERRDRVEEMLQVFALADVDAERDTVDLLLGAGDEVGEDRDQRRRQIVDAVEPHVLEALDRIALAGAADAGDDDERDRLGHAHATGTTAATARRRRRARRSSPRSLASRA
jgi:hypothetical protein